MATSKKAKESEAPEMTLEDRVMRLEAWANENGASLQDGGADPAPEGDAAA